MKSKLINHEIHQNVGIIKGINPPVNALSYEVRKGLVDSLESLSLNDSVNAIILIGEGRTFFAGADISEFGKPMNSPVLNDVVKIFEDSKKPIVAALHGTPLGGGLELAMACHYRVALNSTKMGLPEVKLGIIPGAGGTQRLPRLVGIENSLKIITSGNPISAFDAKTQGLIDAVFENNLLENSKTFVGKILQNIEHKRVRDINDKVNNINPKIFEEYKSKTEIKMRGRLSPIAAIDAIEASTKGEFDVGLEKERQLFKKCHDSEESSSLIHMFFSERLALKIPDIPKDIEAKKINTAAIIGCGTMGGGIAMSFANSGIPVLVVENSQESLNKGKKIIESNYLKTVSKGKLSEEDYKKRMSLIRTDTNIEKISSADIVIEAVFEEMALKKEIFRKIDKIAKPGCILASNTSTLDIDEIANATTRPSEVIGTHFFSPANVMKLLEVVRGKNTGKEIIASTMKLAKIIKKIPVLAGNCDGFIGNRMFHEYIRQANALAEEGAKVAEIDKVIYNFGWAMGPFAVNDLAGNDVGWRIRKRQNEDGKYDNLRYTSTVADRLCEKGRFGQKTGRGFYIYEPESRKKIMDEEVDKMFEEVAKEKGIERRTISEEEILKRLSWSLLVTGCVILEEGYALRASDIDVIYTYGYGYPAWRGGPMKYAESYGLDKVLEDIKKFRMRGDGMWPECNLLKELAEGKNKFN